MKQCSLVVLSILMILIFVPTHITTRENVVQRKIVKINYTNTENAVQIALHPILNKLYESGKLHINHKNKDKTNVKKVYYKVPIGKLLQDYIRKLCKQYNVPVKYVYGVMRVESNYNPNEISSTNDWGIMQIHKASHPKLIHELHVTNLLNPYQNVHIGIVLLGQVIKQVGLGQGAFISYNEGIYAMYEGHRNGVYSTNYSRKVERAIKSLKVQ